MNMTFRLAALLSLGLASEAAAQNSECTPYQANSQDYNVCNAAIDGTEVFHPIAGLLTSGGNPVLGGVGTLGGFGHFSFTARLNGTQLQTPDLAYDGSSGTTVGKGQQIFVPAPLLEAAVGLFPGFNGFLSLDALGSAVLLPTDAVKNLSVDKDARKIGNIALGLGYGARVGVFKGSAIIPSVTVSLMRRDIPRISFGDVTNNGDNYSYSVDLHATNLRAIAGYSIGLADIGLGLGWDKYTGSANVSFVPQVLPAQTIDDVKLNNTRTMAFLTGALNLSVVKLGAEVGYQFGKNEDLATSFDGNDPSKSRLFAGAGLRLSF